MTETIKELMSKIESLESQRTALFEELSGSLAIKGLWPNAFDHGAVTTHIRGSASKGFRFFIKNGIGEEKSLSLYLIPLSLACGDHIKNALKDVASLCCADSADANELLKQLWKVGK